MVLLAVMAAAVIALAASLLRPAGGGPAGGGPAGGGPAGGGPAGGSPAGGVGGRPGQMAPLFESTDVGGRPVALAGSRGHRVVINFWASWCIPCRTEFPVLKAMLAAHPDVVVLGVVFNDSDGPAAAFLRSQGATWPGVRDPRGQIAGAYDVQAKPGIPVSILIDASGRVRDRRFGPLNDGADADRFIAQAAVG